MAVTRSRAATALAASSFVGADSDTESNDDGDPTVLRLRDGSEVRIEHGPNYGLYVPWPYSATPRAGSGGTAPPWGRDRRMYLAQAPKELRALNPRVYDARGAVRKSVVDACAARDRDKDADADIRHPSLSTSPPLPPQRRFASPPRATTKSRPKSAPTPAPASPASPAAAASAVASPAPTPQPTSPFSYSPTSTATERKLTRQVETLRRNLVASGEEIDRLRGTVRDLTAERDMLRRAGSRKGSLAVPPPVGLLRWPSTPRGGGSGRSGGSGGDSGRGGDDSKEADHRLRRLEGELADARRQLQVAQAATVTHRDAAYESDITATRLRESLVGTNVQIAMLTKQLEEKRLALESSSARLRQVEAELASRRRGPGGSSSGGGSGGGGSGGGKHLGSGRGDQSRGDGCGQRSSPTGGGGRHRDSDGPGSATDGSEYANDDDDDTEVAQLEAEIERLRRETRVNKKRLQQAREELANAQEQNERLEADNSALHVVLETEVRRGGSSKRTSDP